MQAVESADDGWLATHDGIVKTRVRMLFSDQREPYANARDRLCQDAGGQALVAVARALHLPAASSARAAYPHAT